MKKFKKFLALLIAVSTVFTFAACKKEDTAVTTATSEEIISEELYEPETDAPATDAVTEPYTEEASTLPVVTDATTSAPEDNKPAETKPVETKPAQTKPQATTVPTTKPIVAPTSKADIVKLYNTAALAASTGKPGYSKTVNTSISNINMGALSKIGAVKDVVGDFLGEGKSSSTVSKGKFDGTSLVKSTLKAEDVTSATCKLSSDKKYYTVEITVKNETNPLKKSSALGKFTKDYKDVDEIRSGINEAGAKVDGITVKTSSVRITAKIAVETNRFESISHSFKMSATLTNVKYSIAKVKKATADLSTTVSYSSFKY